MWTFRRTRRLGGLTLAGLVAAAALAVGGCGSDDPESNGGATATQAAGPAQAGLARAKAVVAPLTKAPETDLPIQRMPALPAGARIVFLKCGVPVCEGYLQGAQAAAKRLGIGFKALNAGNAPATQTQAWDQAVIDAPDAVLEVGFQLSLFSKQLAALRAKGIPVISGGDEGPGVTNNIQPPEIFQTIGQRQADYAIASSGGKAHALFVQTPEQPLVTQITNGFVAEIRKNCPDCTVDTLQVQLQDIGRAIPAQIVSYLQKHPDTDWIGLGFGDMVAGVPEALRGAGLSGVHIVSGAGSKLNWGYIQSGGQEADLVADLQLNGWWMVDRAMHAAAGENIAEAPPLRQRYLTKDTLGFDLNQGWTAIPGYEDQFEQKWKGEG